MIAVQQRLSIAIWKCLHSDNPRVNICLYFTPSSFLPPIESLTSNTKSGKLSAQLLMWESSDPFVSLGSVSLSVGKLDSTDDVANAETRLNFQEIMVYHQPHKADFGAILIPEIQTKNLKLKLQGQWTKRHSFVKMDLSWKQILIMPASLLSFCLGAAYNTLPSPSTPDWRNITTKNSCKLCHKEICTTMNVLDGWKFPLLQGSFIFRHDSVLQILLSLFQSFLST